MKILYSADNRFGAAQPLKDFLSVSRHKVKVAAYPSSGRLLQFIDWNLYAAKHKMFELEQDIKRYYPDLVLIDGEPIVAHIAYKLDIPIVYCSPLHLLDGLEWVKRDRGYYATVEKLRFRLSSFPPGVNKFIYAPFGSFDLSIKENFEWIEPYHLAVETKHTNNSVLLSLEDPTRATAFQEICQNSNSLNFTQAHPQDELYSSSLRAATTIVTDGSVRQIADGIYNNKTLLVCPKIQDPENVLNAILCHNLNLGKNLGQLELAGPEALEQIEQAIDCVPNKYTIKRHKKLHERIDELWECM